MRFSRERARFLAEISNLYSSQQYLQLFYWSSHLVRKFHLHPFWGHFSIWLQSICEKFDFSQKIFKFRLQTFHKCLLDHYLQLFYWHYGREISSSVFQQKTAISYKENSLFAYFSKNSVATWFQLSSNVYQTIIYNFSIDTILEKSIFLDSTAVNMWKMPFLVKKNLRFFSLPQCESYF